jgi:serine/threonine protein kinase
MAPEQMRSSKYVDERADIWALGAILYELLTRQRPFYAENLAALCFKIMDQKVTPVSKYRADVPKDLATAVLRCLAAEKGQRFADVGALASAIEPFAASQRRGTASRITRMLRSAHQMHSKLGTRHLRLASDEETFERSRGEPSATDLEVETRTQNGEVESSVRAPASVPFFRRMFARPAFWMVATASAVGLVIALLSVRFRSHSLQSSPVRPNSVALIDDRPMKPATPGLPLPPEAMTQPVNVGETPRPIEVAPAGSTRPAHHVHRRSAAQGAASTTASAARAPQSDPDGFIPVRE